MNIRGKEFKKGDIVSVVYNNIFGTRKEYVGFFSENVFPHDFGLSLNYNIEGFYDKGFRIKRVKDIRKLK